ncbi:cytochrome b/b6 domain-containing protein [Mucilaginibacter segetis]|uniref:Cytochrome b/b6 domain-containing protein n=1 Tax=Mucilaginibacter segetis TaxID=2793071 RepID=A0A934ULK9_9SPHI|nr:cytochrome b/b6 domain-containing protein [Mucilaginibacter segetis]MBK0378683.1 cytochrome b/b6 domain-containing protein [Mucilaginibacter segetis]
MTVITPPRKDVDHPQQIKKHSSSLRFWHWANTIVITGSLLTVLINSTITDQRSVAGVVTSELTNSGTEVTDQQARGIAHTLSDNVWAIHTYFGYTLAALLLFRLILESFQVADQKFIRKMKSAYHQFKVTKKNRETARHELGVKITYSIFYILLTVMALTGLFLAFEDALAPFKSIRHSVKEVHGFCMYLILAFIAVHLVGIFLAERKEGKGIISDMINGGVND